MDGRIGRAGRNLVVGVAVLATAGCSAMMALRGTEAQGVRMEAPRKDVEQALGKAVATAPVAGGTTTARYVLRVADPKRAERNAVLGMFTYGLSELVMVPVEWMREPDVVEVLYDPRDQVIAARGTGVPGAQLDTTRRLLLQSLADRLRAGQCTPLAPCVKQYEATLRGAGEWMHAPWTPADDARLSEARKIAGEVDAGRMPAADAAKALTTPPRPAPAAATAPAVTR